MPFLRSLARQFNPRREGSFLNRFATALPTTLQAAGAPTFAEGFGGGFAALENQRRYQDELAQQQQLRSLQMDQFQQQQAMENLQAQNIRSLIADRNAAPQRLAERERAADERQAATLAASEARQAASLGASDIRQQRSLAAQSEAQAGRDTAAEARQNALFAQQNKLQEARFSQLAATQAQKDATAAGSAESRVISIEADFDQLADQARLLKAHKGKAAAVGVPGLSKFLPGTDAAGFLTNLETLRAQITFSALQKLREASKTGGALGPVSDKEGQLLMNSVAGLDEKQKETDFDAALDRIILFTEGSKQRLRATLGTQTSPLSLDEAKQYLQRAGGDKNKARELARQEGRTF